jgi:hypothetical protein
MIAPTLPSIIADHHITTPTGWCASCVEPWPCATVRLFRECREALRDVSACEVALMGARLDVQTKASPMFPWWKAASDADRALRNAIEALRPILARLTEEVTP